MQYNLLHNFKRLVKMQPTTQSQTVKFFLVLIFLFLIACGKSTGSGSEPSNNGFSDDGYSINTFSNSVPIATAQSITTDEDIAIDNITLSASDSDGDSLTYTITALPKKGILTEEDTTLTENATLTGKPPTLKYTPNANENGTDSFTFKVNDGTNDSVSNATVSVTITPIADLSVSDAAVIEGDAGTITNLVFTLTLSDFEDVASVDYATSDNTATIDNSDYVAQRNTVNFTRDFLSQTISININGDTTFEPDETLTLNLSNASNLQLSTGTSATGTIIDDDLVPRLNDTGITWSGEPVSGNNNSCTPPSTATINGKQDCHYGRDNDNTKNDDTDGVAGFSFTKLDAKGVPLADQTAKGHACVKDNITGLIWEVKTTTGTRSNDKKYKWGGLTAIGRNHPLKEGAYADDKSKSSWNKLVNYANNTDNANDAGGSLCSFSGWRVPDITELRSIAHLGITTLSIDKKYFPNTQPHGYWSSSPKANPVGTSSVKYYAWNLLFNHGWVGFSDRNTDHYVRLVRGGK
jgi:hypothetical protein